MKFWQELNLKRSVKWIACSKKRMPTFIRESCLYFSYEASESIWIADAGSRPYFVNFISSDSDMESRAADSQVPLRSIKDICQVT